MNNNFTCDICGAESDCTLSKITISGAYGTLFDGEKLKLNICHECTENIINHIMQMSEGNITTDSDIGTGFYY